LADFAPVQLLSDLPRHVRIFILGQGDQFILDVFFEGVVSAVDYYGGKAAVDAIFRQYRIVAVIEVEGDGNARAPLLPHGHRAPRHVGKKDRVGEFTGVARHLQDYRGKWKAGGSRVMRVQSVNCTSGRERKEVW